MNRYNFKRMKDQMVPSEAAQRELREKLDAARPAPRSNAWLKRALPMAACLLLVIGGTLGALRLHKPAPIAPAPVVTGLQGAEGKITGLPVKRELLRDMPGEEGIAAYDRVGFCTLRDFFDWEMDSFVLARVTETQALPPALSDFRPGGRQRATLEILDWDIHPLGEQSYPVVITLTQNRLGGCTMEEQTNLLREDGVYLLPLSLYEGEYSLMGDMDVLFEVDEEGKVFSHAAFEAFAAYDGKPWEALMGDVRAIVRDDPLLKQYSKLARMLRPDAAMTLVELTVTGPEEKAEDEYQHKVAYRPVQTERVLFVGSQGAPPARFSLKTSVWHKEKNVVTQPGERYLLFVDKYEGQFLMEPGRAARVNADGTITPLTDEKDTYWNPFSQLAGMTVEQVQMLIDKAG